MHNFAMPGIPFRNELIIITDAQVANWQVNYANDSAGGPCPSCGDRTVATFVSEAVSMEAVQGGAALPQGFTRFFQCACGGTHMDGSVSRNNCGRAWLVKVMPEGVLPPVHAADDYSLLAAATALSQDEPKQDAVKEQSLIKRSAEKWIAGVTALFGLFGLGGLVVGKDTVASLQLPGRIATGVALLVAVGLAATAVILSYRAAYGWPKVVDLREDKKLSDWYAARQGYASRAANFLKLSVCFAGGALVALLAAVAFVWYMPGSTPTPLVKVTFTDGSSACGQLINSSADGHITVQASDGAILDRPVAELVKSVGVTACSSL